MTTKKTTDDSWSPPFCPNPECRFHGVREADWPYKKIGYYGRQSGPKRIRRYLCRTCGRSFSSQTFTCSYWQKLPGLDSQVLTKTIGGMANRQMARDLGVTVETVCRHIARLARHCLLFHLKMIQDLAPPGEIVIDGFESFEWSQYFPIHHHVAVGKGTDFFYYFTDSPLRRKGSMTAGQKDRRQKLEQDFGRPDPKAIESDMCEVLTVVMGNRGSGRVYSDDHPAYKRSIRHIPCQIDHRITPGSAHRDRNNSLWEVNLLDLLIRHCCANHKRETIAWSKRRQASAERLLILLVWRNYMKCRREKVRKSPTPAMEVGLLERPLTTRDLLGVRLFRSLIEVPPRWSQYYDRTVRTVAIGHQRTHKLTYAY